MSVFRKVEKKVFILDLLVYENFQLLLMWLLSSVG